MSAHTNQSKFECQPIKERLAVHTLKKSILRADMTRKKLFKLVSSLANIKLCNFVVTLGTRKAK